MFLYEYICPVCGLYHEAYASLKDCNKPILCDCGEYAERAICTAPGIINTDSWSDTKFKPHFDEQLGQHFDSREERNNHLKSKGLVEVEGPKSPEGHNNSRPRMSRSQAMKYDPQAVKHNAVKPGRK